MPPPWQAPPSTAGSSQSYQQVQPRPQDQPGPNRPITGWTVLLADGDQHQKLAFATNTTVPRGFSQYQPGAAPVPAVPGRLPPLPRAAQGIATTAPQQAQSIPTDPQALGGPFKVSISGSAADLGALLGITFPASSGHIQLDIAAQTDDPVSWLQALQRQPPLFTPAAATLSASVAPEPMSVSQDLKDRIYAAPDLFAGLDDLPSYNSHSVEFSSSRMPRLLQMDAQTGLTFVLDSGQEVFCSNVALDSGSEIDWFSREAQQRLGIPTVSGDLRVKGVGGVNAALLVDGPVQSVLRKGTAASLSTTGSIYVLDVGCIDFDVVIGIHTMRKWAAVIDPARELMAYRPFAESHGDTKTAAAVPINVAVPGAPAFAQHAVVFVASTVDSYVTAHEQDTWSQPDSEEDLSHTTLLEMASNAALAGLHLDHTDGPNTSASAMTPLPQPAECPTLEVPSTTDLLRTELLPYPEHHGWIDPVAYEPSHPRLWPPRTTRSWGGNGGSRSTRHHHRAPHPGLRPVSLLAPLLRQLRN